MKRLHQLFFAFLIIALAGSCSTDDRLAKSTPKRKAMFEFFNDVRLDIAELETRYSRLEGFTTETKQYLENKDVQSKYKIGGFYFEKGLNRQKGAYDYADRFYPDGCVIHCIVYPPEQQGIWYNLLDYNRGQGKQVGQNYVFYQVFTANPMDSELEELISTIIEKNMGKHAAGIGELFN